MLLETQGPTVIKLARAEPPTNTKGPGLSNGRTPDKKPQKQPQMDADKVANREWTRIDANKKVGSRQNEKKLSGSISAHPIVSLRLNLRVHSCPFAVGFLGVS